MIAFYIALPHSELDQLWDFLLSYTAPTGKLLLASEISKKSHLDISGQHFHVLADWTKHKYEAFKVTVIKKHYNLTGKAEQGGHRKYGIVRGIRDEDKMLSYTIKGNVYRQQNYTEEELQEAYENSYEKQDRHSNIDLCIQHLETMTSHNVYDKETLAIYEFEEIVLVYWIENIKEKVISKTTLHHIVVRFLTQKFRHYKKYIYEILQYIKKNT
jgi:hypothetical protein